MLTASARSHSPLTDMKLQIEAGAGDAGKRLDQRLKDALPDISRGRVQKAIRGGACLVDDEAARDCGLRLKEGQKITFELNEDAADLVPEEGGLDMLWHDQRIAVINKPAGLTVHPCPSCPANTLVQRLLSRFPQIAAMGGERPGIVHRLDKDTSGLLVAALSEEARLKLTAAFSERRIGKEYLALVQGLPEEAGECRLPIGRHPEIKTKMTVLPESKGGRSAHTVWRRLWAAPDESFSLAAVRIHTGRTHQIRVHMAAMGHPILGDSLYAPPKARQMAPRQMLHAARLELAHPITGRPLVFTSPLPKDFLEAMANNSWRAFNVALTGNPGSGKSSFAKALAARGLPVIDADAIIKRLYSGRGAVSDWLSMRGFHEAVAPDGSVIKAELLRLFEKRPEIRKEFEKFTHALVLDQISDFWQKNQGGLAAVAEIPLFFESGWQKLPEKIITAGVRCDQKTRFERLSRNRDWTKEKIEAIESWQMPEEEKMSLCDYVWGNNGPAGKLEENAAEFIKLLKEKKEAEREKLIQRIDDLCRREIQREGAESHGGKG